MCSHSKALEENHSHRCPTCLYIWKHSVESIDCLECHTCPRCGEEEFFVFHFKSEQASKDFYAEREAKNKAREAKTNPLFKFLGEPKPW